MRCKNIKRLIIDASERSLGHEEKNILNKHLASCETCARFQKEYKNIRLSLQSSPTPALPHELESSTLSACQEWLKVNIIPGRAKPISSKAALPRMVWTALFLLTTLTIIILVPLLKEFQLDQSISVPTAVALTLILQNAVMLFFVPLIFRRARSREQGLRLV